MTVELMRVKQIFLVALEIADPTEKENYLRQACGDDAPLRQQVEALLRQHTNAGHFLEKPAFEALLCDEYLESLLSSTPLQEALSGSEEEKEQVERLVQRLWGSPATQDSAGADTQITAGRAVIDYRSPLPRTGEIGGYRLKRLLGEGGMGLVFEAEDLLLRRPVALKVMRPETKSMPKSRERFLREARATAAVRHEHVVTIHQVGETNEVPFFVMELLEGESLEARCRTDPPLSLSEILQIGREVAEGLAAAHATGLTHRDIKPDNIFLVRGQQELDPSPTRCSPRVKLLDFGLARELTSEDAQLTQNGLIVGTPAYMAPEQARGEPVDARTDLFSLGCVLYRLTTGRLPFQGKTLMAILHALANDIPPPLHQLNREIPESLSQLVSSLLAKRPEDRPASAQSVALALASVEQKPADRPIARPARRFFPLVLFVAVGVVTAVLLGVLTARQVEFVIAPALVELNFVAKKQASPAPPILPKLVPADTLDRKDIPLDLLARVGSPNGNAPSELVAVLGGPRHFRLEGAYCRNLYTRFSPDGRFLVTIAVNDVLVYEATTGRLCWRLTHDRECGWFAFRPDNKVLAVSSEGGVDLWDLATGKHLSRLREGAPMTCGLCYTPDGRQLATTDADGKTRLWDVACKKVVRTFEPPTGHTFIQAPQIHPKGTWMALHASGPKPVVQVVDLHTGDIQAEMPGTGSVAGAGDLGYQSTVRFSPDGRLLAAVQNFQAVYLWEVASWKEVGKIDGDASILSFSADSNTLLRGYVWNGAPESGVVVLLDDVKARSRKATFLLPIAGDLAWSDLSPDGATVAVRRCNGNCVALFDVVTGKERFARNGHQAGVTAVAVSPDGRSLVSTGQDHRALLWDLPTGREVRELTFVPTAFQRLFSAAFSPDGKWVAALMQETTSPGWIRVWETATGKEVVTLPGKGHDWQITEFAFHPKGGVLITSTQNRLQTWNLQDGSSMNWEQGHDKPIETVAIHPDGQQVAAGDKGGVVCLWHAPTSKRLCQFQCEGAVRRVRFSPDGQMLAATTAAPDAALYLWDLQTGKRTRRGGHEGSVLGLAWRPDSQTVATASGDGAVRLWSRDSQKQPRTFRLPGARRSLAFTPEGRHLLTANDDGSIFVLRLEGPAATP